MQDKKDLERLNWLLEFSYMDLPNVPVGDFNKLSTEIFLVEKGLLYSGKYDFLYLKIHDIEQGLAQAPEVAWYRDIDQLIRIQRKLREFMEDTFLNLQLALDRGAEWLEEAKFKSVASFNRSKGPAKSLFQLQCKTDMRAGEFGDISMEMKWSSDAKEQAIIRVTDIHEDPADTIISRFIEYLDRTPWKRIGKCPECGHWFIQLSNREKTYCTNKCTQKKVSRDSYLRKKERRKQQAMKEDPQQREAQKQTNVGKSKGNARKKSKKGDK
jgi:hypothetical protein